MSAVQAAQTALEQSVELPQDLGAIAEQLSGMFSGVNLPVEDISPESLFTFSSVAASSAVGEKVEDVITEPNLIEAASIEEPEIGPKDGSPFSIGMQNAVAGATIGDMQHADEAEFFRFVATEVGRSARVQDPFSLV